MRLVSLRPSLGFLFGATLCLALSPRPGGAAKDITIAHFFARAVSVLDAKDAGPIEVRVLRWATDEELESLRGALLESSRGSALPVFRKSRPPMAVVFVPGVQALGARSRERRALDCQFARQFETPAGRQIVIATDIHLGIGENPRPSPASGPEFTLLEIRLGPDGKGVGKLAPAAKVVYNKDKKIFEIEDYEAQPVRLSDLRSQNP